MATNSEKRAAKAAGKSTVKAPATAYERVRQAATQGSTWAGLAALGALFGVREVAVFGAPEVAIAIASLAAIVLP